MEQPIRILNMFTIMDRGGAETMVMNYYRHIDRTKVQFDFLVHREQRGAYDDEIEALGGKIYRLSPIYPQNFARYKKELRAFFSEHKEYRVIHSHMSELGYFAFREAKQQGVPVRICHAHNAPHGFDAKMIVRTWFKLCMMPYLTHLFTCGQEAGNWLYGKKNAARFIMLNNAIDAKSYRFDPELRRSVQNELGVGDGLVIGHVGRFARQKNHMFLLDIFAAVLQREPKAKLLLVGGGSLQEEVETYAKQLGVLEHVLFVGVRSDVNRLMQAMDVFVFPSLFEGLPVTMVEAQGAGLPCVISDRVPEECILTDTVSVLSLQDNAEQWAEFLMEKQHVGHKDTYEAIKAKGFDVASNAAWLEKFYLEMWMNG